MSDKIVIETDSVKKENATKKSIYNKKYYENKKEQIKAKYSLRVICALCDKQVNKSSLSKHINSKICNKQFEIKKKLLELQFNNTNNIE